MNVCKSMELAGIKCACTKCGPPGRGCDITISFVAIGVFAAMTGKEMPSSLLDARNHPGYCDDCRDHILLELRKTPSSELAKREHAEPDMCQ